MTRRQQKIVTGLVVLVSGYMAWSMLMPLLRWWNTGGYPEGPWFERESSPDGRYEVVRENRNWFLDGYMKLWITTTGEQDRTQWLLIAPEVDGRWETEWLGPNDLMITDFGGGGEWRRPYRVLTWRDVRIETRPRPTYVRRDSSDQMHYLEVWTHEDSRGRRSSACLRTDHRNGWYGSIDLAREGPWSIEGQWLANHELLLRVTPAAGAAVPPVPDRWRDIVITAAK